MLERLEKEKEMEKENKFTIDFFELAFLAESCIPPRPIARACFWERLINEIYLQMSDFERGRLHEWILRCPNFNLENKDCAWFHARFDPNNQYLVHYRTERESGEMNCFLKEGKYWTKKNTWISDEFIKRVEKAENKSQNSTAQVGFGF
jgi:hypothetical protein